MNRDIIRMVDFAIFLVMFVAAICLVAGVVVFLVG